MSAYPWYRSRAAATASAARAPKYLAAAAQQTIGAGVQHRHRRLGEPPAEEIEREPGEERRDRRPEEHRPRQEDVVVEELDVREEVLVEVAARPERPRDRADRVRHASDDEQQDHSPWLRCLSREPRATAHQHGSSGRHSARG